MISILLCLIARIGDFAIAPTPEYSSLPFTFSVEDAARAAYTSPASATPRRGVYATLRLPKGRVDLFQERPGAYPRWAWRDGAIATDAPTRLAGDPGLASLLILRRPGESGYEVCPVFRWPSDTREMDVRLFPARTLLGSDSKAAKSGEFKYLSHPPSPDLLCESDGSARWQCLGVPARSMGVLASCSTEGELRFMEVSPGAAVTTQLQADGWAGAILVEASDTEESITCAGITFSLVSPGGGGGQTRTARSLTAFPLGNSMYWIHGPLIADSHLLARRPGGSGRIAIDDFAATRCVEPVRLAIVPTRGIRGSIADKSGQALPEASVLALEETRPRSGESGVEKLVLVASAKADEQGRYSFAELDSRVGLLRACHARAGCADRRLAPGTDVLDFSISSRWQFAGRAVSRSGVPVSDAHLRLVPTLENYARAADRLLLIPPESDALTDREGRFEISAPTPASYFLEARATGLGTGRRRLDVTELSPPRTELGDLVLAGAGEFLAKVVGSGCSGGSLTFIGPIDVGTPASMRDFPLENDVARIEVADGGTWLVQARCSDGVRAVSPEVLSAVQDLYGQEVRFTLGEKVESPQHRN